MELNIADVFTWLAFVEALSFEDFKLAMTVGVEDFALAMAIGSRLASAACDRGSGEAVLISAAGDRRLLLLSGPPFTCPQDVTEKDIVCVCPVAPARNVTTAARVEQLFRDLVGRGVRTCLVYRLERPHSPAEVAAAVEAQTWIEWPTPNSNGTSLSGLVFSDRWRADASSHAARTVASFMGTLAPEARGTTTPSVQQAS
jgi:hypothetical protein